MCAKRASQFVYALTEGSKQAWLESLGELLRRLQQNAGLQSSPRSALIARLLLEQYQIEGEEQRVVLKPAQEISADSLQSPHDEEAAYRKKKDETVRGYSINATETCAEELNLIVDVQVDPATAADNGFVQGAVTRSEAVLEGTVQEVSTDGAYYSEENETYAKAQGKEIHYTGFPGKAGRFDYERGADGVVVIDGNSGARQLAEEYKPGRYRFRVDGKWRYITDHDNREGGMSAANGESAAGVIQPALQCRGNDLSPLLPHQAEKAEVPWQIPRAALGDM